MTQRLDVTEAAVGAFRRGDPVLIHDSDDREAETDLVYPAAAVTPQAVRRLRNEAGGLVCVAFAASVADAFDLPLLEETLDHPATGGEVAYDDRSSFSISVNHRDTYTGITDRDRSRTIQALATAANRVPEYDLEAFAGDFRAPGHVHLLRAASSLTERRGHTEFGVAIAEAAGREPAAVVCEMLDDASGEALPKTAAREYAARHDLVFLEGATLIETLE